MGMAQDDLQTLHDALVTLLPAVGRDLLQQPYETEEKGQDGLDFVTSVDYALQSALEVELARILPGAHVYGEEGFAAWAEDSRLVWLVDPLDGTVNFVAGLPCYAMAVVLLVSGRPVLAAVYDAVHNTVYSAIAQGGAFVNGAPLQRRQHQAALAIVSSGLLKDLAQSDPAGLVDLLSRTKLRNFGSQALHLCYAAAGHVILVASREAKAWDDMAGALIATEAGLRYGSFVGRAAAPDADQHSLCTAPDLFDSYSAVFARSLA